MTDQTARFDLRQEPWIPVIDRSGRHHEIGIRDLLVGAHELAAIADPSPLVEVALHRLLMAILHRVINGPTSPEAWNRIWKRRQFEASLIDAYLDPLADRFDLFGAERPFYQVRGLIAAGVKAGPIVRLTHELASEGNSALLFDHTLEHRFSPARAARALVSYQTFVLGGTVTRTPGSQNPSAPAAPVALGAVFRARGRSLFETLLANLVRYDPAAGVPVAGVGLDLPAWERLTTPDGATRQPTGYLDVLTWQSRLVELALPGPDGGVAQVAVIAGDRVAPGRGLWAIEPTMLAFVQTRSSGFDPPLREVRLSLDRALWRDSTVLLAGPGKSPARRPGIVDWLAELAVAGYTDLVSVVVPLEVAGLVANHAKTLLWRRETLPLPLAALHDLAVAEQLHVALAAAERVGRMLGDGDLDADAAGRALPRPLADLAKNLLERPGARPRPDAIRSFVRSTGAAARYWAALATAFSLFVHDLAAANEATDAEVARAAAVRAWEEAVREAAQDAFARATSGVGRSTRALFAVAESERDFRAGLARALPRPRNTKEVLTA